MHAHFEPLRRHDAVTSLLAFERRESHFPFHWHHHPEWELTGILQGSGQRLVGDHVAPYEPGDLVLVGPHLPHTWASRGPPTPGARHRAAGVHFSLHALPADLLARPEFQAIRDLLARAERGLQFSPDIARSVQPHLQGLGRQTGLTAWLDLVGLLAILATDPHARPLATARFHPQPPLARQAQFERALRYIDMHGEGPCRLREVARAAGVSVSTLTRFFRRLAARSFVDYLNERRVDLACNRLLHTEQSVAEIAFASGFNNLANFNRCFRRRQHMTPSEFRARWRQAAAR